MQSRLLPLRGSTGPLRLRSRAVGNLKFPLKTKDSHAGKHEAHAQNQSLVYIHEELALGCVVHTQTREEEEDVFKYVRNCVQLK